MSDRLRPRRRHLSAVTLGLSGLLGAVATGCSEPPSYLVRWKVVDEAGLADPDSAAALTRVTQCAEVGVARVQVTTSTLGGQVVDSRQYACFPSAFESGDSVEVPLLPDGEYEVLVEGLRRTGEPWTCEVDPDVVDPPPCIARAEGRISILEDTLPTIEVVLLQPSQCDDGVDNDRDGRVDGKDPACILDSDGLEADDASVTLFQLSVAFLDSPAIRPANVSVDGLRLEVDGELLTEVVAGDLDLSQWPYRLPLVTESFDPGTHQFSMVAIDAGGVVLTTPFEQEFSVSEVAAGFVLETVEWGSDDFLTPIVEPVSVSTSLRLAADDVTGPPCTLGGFVGGVPVTIDETWFRISDAGGQPLAAAALGLTGLGGGAAIVPVDEAGGWVSFACPSSIVTSMPLAWGNYTLEVEARIADTVCFSTDAAQDLAPVGQAGAQVLGLDRVVDAGGVPPVGCEECVTDSDCSGQVCDVGICKDNQP